MKRILSCIFALSVCAVMLSACESQENNVKTETVSNSETTASAEEASEAVTTTDDTAPTTEENEAKEEINYQKKCAITYPVEGDSYISKEYEYGDNGYYKEISYNNGVLSACNEYKNDILLTYTIYDAYNDGLLISITEYDESEINFITKQSQYNNKGELSCEMFWDYQPNDDKTEILVTNLTIYYNWADTDERNEYEYKYIQRYEYDETGRVIHEYQYDEDSDAISMERYYEYDINGNKTMEKLGESIISKYEYDNNGNLTHYHFSTEYRSSDTYYDYDEYGRQIGWTEYDSDGNETSHSVVEYE